LVSVSTMLSVVARRLLVSPRTFPRRLRSSTESRGNSMPRKGTRKKLP